jgi:uroporphyrinogen decarboxylase
MPMSKTERVQAALRGEPVDRVPVSAWWHDWKREWSAADLAEMTLAGYRKYGWDFVKVNPRYSYYAEPWGAEYQRYDDRQPTIATRAVESVEHLRRIEPLDGVSGAWGEQLEALRLIAAALRGDAPLIQTVFTPLAVMSSATGSPKFVQKLMREHGADLEAALDAISQTLARYAGACLGAGASGIFFAGVDWGTRDNIAWEDYERFGKPYDLPVLAAVQGAPFNVLHVCRNNNHLLKLLDYRVAAFHWDAHGEGNPSLSEAMAATGKTVMGGVRQSTMLQGQTEDVTAEARAAMTEAGARRFMLAPGCSIDPNAPEANLRALAVAAA